MKEEKINEARPFVRAMLDSEALLKAKKSPEAKPPSLTDVSKRTGFPVPTLWHWNNGQQPALSSIAIAALAYNWTPSRTYKILMDEASLHVEL